MLALERTRVAFIGLPIVVRIGLLLMVLGGLGDVVAHLEAAGHAEPLDGHTASELSAHLLGFTGMVVILLGVVVDGVRRTRPDRSVGNSTTPTGGSSTPQS